MGWHRGHIPLIIHQHGKDRRTHKSNEGKVCWASEVREGLIKNSYSPENAHIYHYGNKSNWNCYKLAWKRTHVYFPPCTVRTMIREVKKIPQGELHMKVAFWGHQVSKITIRHHRHANKLFGRHARKTPFMAFHPKRKRLKFEFWLFDFNLHISGRSQRP